MKTSATPKLLAALILGISSLAFAPNALADNNSDSHGNSGDNSGKSSDSHGGDNSGKSSDSHGGDDSSNVQNSCTGVVTNACGITFIKTTCSGSAANSNTDDHDESKSDKTGHNEDYDDHHDGKKDSDGNSDDKTRVSRDHSDKTNKTFTDGSNAGKVWICHRMGGATVSLNVANDGWLNGHSKHPMDTIGKCENYSPSHGDDDSEGYSATDAELLHSKNPSAAPALTPNVISCLSAPAGTQVTVNGQTYTAPGGNAPGVTITIPTGLSAGGAGPMPGRGGVRSLR